MIYIIYSSGDLGQKSSIWKKASYFQTSLSNKLGIGGVQGQVKGQRLMGIKAVNDSIGLATCQNKIYEK